MIEAASEGEDVKAMKASLSERLRADVNRGGEAKLRFVRSGQAVFTTSRVADVAVEGDASLTLSPTTLLTLEAKRLLSLPTRRRSGRLKSPKSALAKRRKERST